MQRMDGCCQEIILYKIMIVTDCSPSGGEKGRSVHGRLYSLDWWTGQKSVKCPFQCRVESKHTQVVCTASLVPRRSVIGEKTV